MAVRIKEGVIPYKGGVGIEITNNHIINVLLREANNLIHVNENNELYVDLQIPDGVTPDYNFEVGVTTGKILQEDGWPQSGLILNWKTTSGDYARLIYANDGNLYIDYGDGVWHLIGGGGPSTDCNTRTFYLPIATTDPTTPDLTEIQDAMDWYFDGKDAILWYGEQMYVFYKDDSDTYDYLDYISTQEKAISWENEGICVYAENGLRIYFTPGTHTVERVEFKNELDSRAGSFIPANTSLRAPFMATEDSHPISKAYLDQELAKKQDVLTAGTRISITVDPNTGQTIISADVSGAMVYKGNVTDPSQLPSSGNTQGDCWYSESNGHMYAWDGTQWKDVGGTGINYTAGTGISIDSNNVISNTAPFSPSNQGNVGDVIKKTQNGYEWGPDEDTTYSAGSGINIDNNNVISNTGVLTVNSNQPDANGNVNVDEFDPENAGSTGQVLKKTATGYEWANESGGGNTYYAGNGIDIDSNNVISNEGVITVNNQHPDASGNINVSGTNYTAGSGIRINSSDVISNDAPFDPDNIGSAGQVLKKTQRGYEWQNESGSSNVKLFTLSSTSDLTTAQQALDWYNAGNLPIIRLNGTHHYTDSAGVVHNITGDWDYYPEPIENQGTDLVFISLHTTYDGYENGTSDTHQWDYTVTLQTSNTTVTGIVTGTQTAAWTQFLSTNFNYSTPYTPLYPGSPATKQYVDSRNWVGTQAQYNNLPSIDPTVIYNII